MAVEWRTDLSEKDKNGAFFPGIAPKGRLNSAGRATRFRLPWNSESAGGEARTPESLIPFCRVITKQAAKDC